MGILATIVTNVGRDTQARGVTPLFYTHTLSTQCVKRVECWATIATADWEIRAASWQLAATWAAGSRKKTYEGKRKKEGEKKFTSSFPFHNQKLQLSNQTAQKKKHCGWRRLLI